MNMTKRFLLRLGAIILASFLFFLSHPNPLFEKGLGLLGFIALVPIFVLVPQVKLSRVCFYGFVYGLLSYALMCFWLFTFRWYTLYFACLAYAFFMALVFVLMKLLCMLRPSLQFLSMSLVWLCYEYVKTLGFAALHYGIIAYTQWQNTALLTLSSVGGVWLVSAICLSVNASLAFLFTKGREGYAKKQKLFCKSFFLKTLPAFCVILLCLFCHVWGMILHAQYFRHDKMLSAKKLTILALQSNTDPWKMEVSAYKSDLQRLINLTENALEKNPDAQIVVWPETAFVPPLIKNFTLKNDVDRYALVKELLSFIEQKDLCFIIGNQHSVDEGKAYYSDYNAALVFDKRATSIVPPEPFIYKKQHLVPFTEWFPYGKTFPRLYKMLLNGDTHLWDKGQEATVFNLRGISFSTPICFEDTFSDGCRLFVKKGARCFINLSNDAWSKSLSCQMQHLSMAVFRSAENHVPSVRSTSSGMTVSVNAFGKVEEAALPFTATCLVAPLTVTENAKATFYTRWGDWFAYTVLVLTLGLSLVLCVLKFYRQSSRLKA